VANSALLNLINSLTNQSSNDINASLNALHPALFSAYGEYQTETVGQIVLLLHRWPYKACEPFHPNHFWVELLGDWFSEKAVDFQSGFDTQVRAIAAGFNEQIGQHWMAGISAIYENGHLQWDQSGSAGTAQTFYGALYADYLTDRGHLGATFMAGYDDYDTARKIFIQSTNATAKSNSSGHEFIAHLTGSLEYDLKQTLLSPRLDLTYLYLQSNPFTENGAEGLNLSVASTTSQTLRGELGLSGQRKVAYEKGCAAFSLTGSWIVEKPLCRSQIEATFQGANIPFAVAGWNRTLMLFSPSADIHASYKWFGFGIRYKAEIGPRFFGQVGELRLDARW
jgi:uncharacterized protein with beta-barrel porin domain